MENISFSLIVTSMMIFVLGIALIIISIPVKDSIILSAGCFCLFAGSMIPIKIIYDSMKENKKSKEG